MDEMCRVGGGGGPLTGIVGSLQRKGWAWEQERVPLQTEVQLGTVKRQT